MLELDQVSKRLGSFQLRNITIQIPTGYLCGLAGEKRSRKDITSAYAARIIPAG